MMLDEESAEKFRDLIEKDFVLELVEAVAEYGKIDCGPIYTLYKKDPSAFKDDEFINQILNMNGIFENFEDQDMASMSELRDVLNQEITGNVNSNNGKSR